VSVRTYVRHSRVVSVTVGCVHDQPLTCRAFLCVCHPQVVFMTGVEAFPDGLAASIYFSWPGRSTCRDTHPRPLVHA
jgi:hypothetical protein